MLVSRGEADKVEREMSCAPSSAPFSSTSNSALRQTLAQVWLWRFSLLVAGATLALLCVGGLVTSHGVGMAVPDWPNTYGYNMFLFPISQWVGGILYEHSHRLVASAVGFLTILLAFWLQKSDPRPWVRKLGWIALAAVIIQGVLGGLRVVWMKDEIGILHATLAQLFFSLICILSLVTSPWWWRHAPSPSPAGTAARTATPCKATSGAISSSLLQSLFRPFQQVPKTFYWFLSLGMLILIQLILGASMRHQHAGLAIPDFPLAYGRTWPATDQDSLHRYNQARIEVNAQNPITAAHIHLHMTHRLVAGAILVAASATAIRSIRNAGIPRTVGWVAVVLCAITWMQAALGAATVWTGKSADVATAHVALGSLCLAVSMGGAAIGARLASFREAIKS